MSFMLIMAPATQAKEIPDNVTAVTVQGTNAQELEPDIAYVNLGVITEAVSVHEAQAKNAAVANQVCKAIEAAGIRPEYIRTANYTVAPLYNYDEKRKSSTIRGYQVTNNVVVTLLPAAAGEIIDTALKAGANQVNSVRFGRKDEAEAKNTAIQLAVKDGLSKAASIAQALNKKVVRVKTVNESGVYLQNPERSNLMYAKSAGAADSITPVSPGLINLTANVQLLVELE